MRENKALSILSYIVIGIILIPIIAILLYVIFGISLFLILYIINRIKYGKSDPKEGKNYKLTSSIIIIVGAIIMVFGFNINFNLIPDWNFNEFNWIGYFSLQLLIFIGIIPLDFFFIKKLKCRKEVE